jgi:hypothetical protein
MEEDYVRKYDSGGNLIWSKQLGTSAPDSVLALAMDPNGVAGVLGARCIHWVRSSLSLARRALTRGLGTPVARGKRPSVAARNAGRHGGEI